MKKIPWRVLILVVALLTIGAWLGRQVQAAPAQVIFTVDTQADLIDADTSDGLCLPTICSLRAAIMQADTTTGPGVSIIVPAGTYTLTRPAGGMDGPDNGDLNLTAPSIGDPLISIIGAGADSTVVDANYIDRVLAVAAGRRAIISGLTIRHGLLPSSGSGGGIYNAGTLTLTQVILTANQAQFGAGLTNASGTLVIMRSLFNANLGSYGGGIYNPSGTLSVVQSAFNGNTAVSGAGLLNASSRQATLNQSTLNANAAGTDGGGVYNTGSLLVTQSTLSANTAGTDGGGIYNYTSAQLVVVNSTLSSNSANNNGGGIWNYSQAGLFNTTVVYNLADADQDINGGRGGGIWNDASGTFNLTHTLVAGNTATDPQAGFDDCIGTLNASGWNLFWSVDSLSCTVNTQNITWGVLSSLAVIGPLQNNGGPTFTHALLASSNPIGNPIDAGGLPPACIDNNGFPLVADQRGAARSVDGDRDGVARCDIGAFEYQPPLYLPLLRR